MTRHFLKELSAIVIGAVASAPSVFMHASLIINR